MAVEPVDLREIDKNSSNVYEAVLLSAKRARQINDERKLEYNESLKSLPAAAGNDEDGEDFHNPAQLKLSADFEKREKPHIQGLKDLLAGSVKYQYKQR